MSAWMVLAVFVVAVAALSLASRRHGTATARRGRRDDGQDDDDGAHLSTDDVGIIAIEDAIDLHGFQPREIPEVVESYLEAAIERGLSEVRLIHGRGKGVQRKRVRAVLERHPDVVDFADAPAHRGGWGATIAQLRTGHDDVVADDGKDPR